MPIWLNLLLGIGLQFVTFFGVAFLLFVKGPRLRTENTTVFLYFIGIAVSVFLVRFLFRRFVPAKCPECGGRANCKGSRPIYYECADCGHVHETNVREGSSRRMS